MSLAARLRLPLLLGVPLVLLAALGVLYLASGRYQSTDDAYVRAAQVSVSANVAGRVLQVAVTDNQRVHQGQVLFRLDDRPFRIAVDAARARLADARLAVLALKATYRQHLAEEGAARSRLDYARGEYERQRRLLATGVASQAGMDRARQDLEEARQRLAASEAQSRAARAALGDDPDVDPDRHPRVRQARAALDQALLDLSWTVVMAPIDGVVTRVESLQPGDYLNAATPAFALVSDRDLWVEANFKEDQLTHMRAGQPARVVVDAWPDQPLEARVASVSPGTGSEFSVLPPENATGNWVKVVQRLPVRLQLSGRLPPLRAGLSAVVRVDTGYRRHLFPGETVPR